MEFFMHYTRLDLNGEQLLPGVGFSLVSLVALWWV